MKIPRRHRKRPLRFSDSVWPEHARTPSSAFPLEPPDGDDLIALELQLTALEEEFRRRLRDGATVPASEFFQLEEARSIVQFARDFSKKGPAAGLIILDPPRS